MEQATAPFVLGLAACGAGAGIMGAILGVGGGIFLVPALVLGFGFPMASAVALSLAAVIATSNAVASVNVQRGIANIRLGMLLETTTVSGAILGAVAASHVPARLLIGLFGFIQAVLSVTLWRGQKAGDEIQEPRGEPGPLDGAYDDQGLRVRYHLRRLPAALGVSGAAGVLSGMLGVGGGFLKVPVLHLYCGMPMKAAAATSNFMIGVTAAASALVYLRGGHIPALPAALVVLGVLAGSMVGARLSARLKDRNVRHAFALLLAVLAAKMLWRGIHG